ncbi:flagellar hook-associated protein FlgK [Roseibium polysiphoniae]|uniref:Flagellar hook-associated protein 1 n=1 Tax=Roseibium polysiphoniae TaxID=2571221 RepID=A0A944GSZ4_9HYPH|nr:flagellar hook-associated protein FlgK [Roseibium polysiphoniae]MBS8260662.1 flagellar hook-associated protein FlgK [Roseibium polysiphoniae]
MTSLTTSSYIAASALTAAQVQLSVASSNIANADTEGYTAKSASAESQTTLGYGSGVAVTGIASSVSQYLLDDLLTATTNAANTTVTADYLDGLQQSFGSTTGEDGDGSSISNTIATFESAVTELAETPESESLASAAVSALEDVTYQLNSLATDVQQSIDQADEQIADGVMAANEAIETIDALNEQIEAASARGDSTADLEDQLNASLVSLSEQLEIATFKADDGTVKVYTSDGQVLVDGSAHLLTTETAADGTTSISANGTDITGDLDTGNLGALIELRDETLPAYQDMLDELATTFIDELNTVSAGLLTGTGASDIAVSDTVQTDPSLLLGETLPSEVAYDLLDVLQASVSFDAAGDLSADEMSFTDYANSILSNLVNATTTAETRLELAETELSTISDTISSTYGVNVDEELTRLSELEQLYSIASTLLSVVQEMFDDLLTAVQ